MEEAAKATMEAVGQVDSEIKLVAFVIGCLFVAISIYMIKVDRDSKRLVQVKEDAEIERTASRKRERDAELNGITARFDAEIKDIREDIANHLEAHKTADNRLYDRLGKIEDNMHNININLAEIKIRMEMSETEKGRHEHHQ